MKKIPLWIWDNILFLQTLFLLIFIPLYPKLPLVDIKNTWVYIRAEDFIILVVIATWIVLLLKRKISLKTPLTLSIIIFWIIGAIATIYGVVLIFPTLSNVFPNVAFLAFLRHIEYISLFFIGYSGMKEKKHIPVVVFMIILTLFLVALYGFGQKYFGFPAFLTMNEEFAKGIPIQLSSLSRVPSTFAGHYDLAAYLVFVIPILVSLFFGLKNLIIKAVLLLTACLGVALLFMTVSRVSVFVLVIALFVVFFFQKKKLALLFFPLLALLAFLLISFKPTLLARFGNTVKEIDVLVDAKTGSAIGQVSFVSSNYLKDKVIVQEKVSSVDEISVKTDNEQSEITSYSGLSYKLPAQIPLVVAANLSTGESLPQGTGYINLVLSPVTKKITSFFYELPPSAATTSSEVRFVLGDFIIKKAAAYDLSFTTRFQGEWPHAIEAFKKNILLGSGYGSVSLAVDNNYLRMLGETGILGTVSFFAIFLVVGIYIKKTLPHVDSRMVRSLLLGVSAGIVGLALNATLIDVFEASKIAYMLWLLVGIIVGILSLYQKKEQIHIYKELIKVATSSYAVILYVFVIVTVVFSPIINNFFVGDDFTWFRWAAECKPSVLNPESCGSITSRVFQYFADSSGFFFRPGTKIYFLAMYSVFWLNQVAYHLASVFLHFVVVGLLFLITKKILKDTFVCAVASLLFLVISGYLEVVVWISSTGHLFNAIFVLLSLFFYTYWEEKKKVLYYVLCLFSIILGLLFHEFGVVAPILVLVYKFAIDDKFKISFLLRKVEYVVLFSPIIFYLVVRYFSQSHWFAGDYNYNLIKFPFNAVGNILGYAMLGLFGPISLPFYNALRNITRENVLVSSFLVLILLTAVYFISKFLKKKLHKNTKRALLFGFLFFITLLLPFLGLGNIASRYSYLASFIVVLFFVLFIKKLYVYLLSYGKDIALAATIMVISIFSLLHVIQTQQFLIDWHESGVKAQRFFISIDELYADIWSKEGGQLHFVNVPIRNGQAWIFPVGFSDAIWFAFKNDDLSVYTHSDIDTALEQAGTSPTAWVFMFQDDGSLKEVPRKPSQE